METDCCTVEYRRIYAKIDLDALEHNFSLIESKIPDGVGIIPVIKADAYGHGAVEVARLLEGRCSLFGVAVIDEAIELRHAGITTPILILGYSSPEQYASAVENDITLTVFNAGDAGVLSNVAASAGKCARVHIAVDTGMSRIGFQVTDSDADEAAKIFQLPNIEVEGLFSHYATADEADRSHAHIQREKFDTFAKLLRDRGCTPKMLHLDNSAGIMDSAFPCYDAVRAGIILYGLYPSDEVEKEGFPLMPVMELITHVSHVKMLPAGVGISYGRTYITDSPTTVATIPVGYADGYHRSLSNRGSVIIHGKRCPIIGRICMDQMMVDVTTAGDVCVGDKVTLIGRDEDEFIPVEEVADLAYSFNYEFVCNIGRRVPKAYFKDSRHIKTVSYLEY